MNIRIWIYLYKHINQFYKKKTTLRWFLVKHRRTLKWFYSNNNQLLLVYVLSSLCILMTSLENSFYYSSQFLTSSSCNYRPNLVIILFRTSDPEKIPSLQPTPVYEIMWLKLFNLIKLSRSTPNFFKRLRGPSVQGKALLVRLRTAV